MLEYLVVNAACVPLLQRLLLISKLPQRRLILPAINFDVIASSAATLDEVALSFPAPSEGSEGSWQAVDSRDGFWLLVMQQLMLRSRGMCLPDCQWLWKQPSLYQWEVPASSVLEAHIDVANLYGPEVLVAAGHHCGLTIEYDSEDGGESLILSSCMSTLAN